MPPETFLKIAEDAVRQLGSRAHQRLLLRGGLDASSDGTADHPRGVHCADAAGEYRPSGRRHPGSARTRVHPGFDRHPDALQPAAGLYDDAAGQAGHRVSRSTANTRLPHPGWWGESKKYMVSLLKAWWGDAATEANGWCFDYLPRLTGDHSHMTSVVNMIDGTVKGYFVMGENPTVGSPNAAMQRARAAQSRVVRGARSGDDRNGGVLEELAGA